MSTTATSPTRADRPSTGDERRDRLLQRRELGLDHGVLDLDLEPRNLELRPVGGLDGPCTGNSAVNCQLSSSLVGSS